MALRSPKLSLQPGSAFYQAAGRSTGFVGEFTAVNGGASRAQYPTRHESKVENRVARKRLVSAFWHEEPEDEQLANYLYDLEAKLRNEQIIDFVRAVSPAIYRIFMRLIQLKIPDITNYIHNSKESSYDRWKFESLHASENPILQQFHSESVVNSSSLTELIVQLDLPDSVKVAAQQLRELEKSVRNPLAHLIKPFDEEELHRTTGFSSQDFMKNLIDLASYTGIHYDQANFYFDQANAVMEELLKEK